MFIKQVLIKNLWQKGDIAWDFEEDANVLVGINGSGKSTILNLVYEALQPEISDEAKKRYFSLVSELTIHFTDDTFISVDSSGERFPVNIENLGINITKISTFDISHSLDDLIGELAHKFETFQKNVYKRINEAISPSNDLPDRKKIEDIVGPRNSFVKIINDLFKATGKSFIEDSFRFKLDKQEYELTYKQLSSGEKQIFYILLHTLIQDRKPNIMLMDEPEISLHIEWQRDLISNIRQLNPYCQVVVVTHSSNMFFRDWVSRKKSVEDIRDTQSSERLENVRGGRRLKRFSDEFNKIIQGNHHAISNLSEVNAMIHRSFFILSLQECKSILKTMKDAKILPDHFTYTTLISKTTSLGDAKKILATMKQNKIAPNVVTYVHILKKAETFEEAMRVFDEMRKERIDPAIQHFSVLLGKADNAEFVQRVEELRSFYNVPSTEIYANKLRVKK